MHPHLISVLLHALAHERIDAVSASACKWDCSI